MYLVLFESLLGQGFGSGSSDHEATSMHVSCYSKTKLFQETFVSLIGAEVKKMNRGSLW